MNDIIPNNNSAQGGKLNHEKWLTVAMYVGGMVNIFPFSNIIVPLVIWLLKKDESNIIKSHGINVLNFQITISILMLVILGITALTFFLVVTIPLSGFAVFALAIANIIVSIIGAVKAYKNEFYQLPLQYKFIKE